MCGGCNETWIVDEPEEKRIWLNAFPLVRPNGDMLALDLREKETNPPVINLAHEDESRIIAESFDRFLQDWAMIGYVGPDVWVLDEFIAPETKLLAPNQAKAEQFRKLIMAET